MAYTRGRNQDNEPKIGSRHSVDWAMAHGILKEDIYHDIHLHKVCTRQEILEYLYLIFKEFTKEDEV